MFQVRLGPSNNDAAGIKSSVTSYVLDDLSCFLKAGAISDGVQYKKYVRISDDVFKLLFGILKDGKKYQLKQ